MNATVRFVLILHFFTALLLAGASRAGQVPDGQARNVAMQFLAAQGPQFVQVRAEQLVLAGEVGDPAIGDKPAVVLYRIYNVADEGFVIIGGDDRVLPVLGYSTEGTYANGALPVNLAKWLEGYRHEIREALEAEGEPSPSALAAWARWEQGGTEADGAERAAVAPLLQTTWDQPAPYNALCPGGSVTGCVATAMAQVMKYHNWPAQGTGFHSYNSPNYGTLSANFGATTYEWGSMPNSVSGANNAVATLMYHCGVSVDMGYSPQVSGAWVIQANSQGTDHNTEYALKTYFNYSSNMQGLQRANYSDGQWISMLKTELDASRPVIYDGFGSGGGHCFVADGYDNNDFFHFNWGWSGSYDGYFTISALNPDGQGTGGGTGGYNSGQEAIFGVQPATGGGGGGGGQQTFNMGLNAWVFPSASTLYYGDAFSVSANVVNNGTNNFNGDYCAAVFDDASNFYGYVQTLSGYTLQPGNTYINNLVFSTAGMLTMLPGTYYIGIFYRPANGEWVLVDDYGGYTNLAQVEVINPNDIELGADLGISPGTSIAQGGTISVSTNIVNDGWNTFYGQYGAGLFNLDGTWAQDIGILSETGGLPSGYTYNSPLTFGPVNVTVQPGTYLLAVQHNPGNSGWQLTGSSYHDNPVFVTVTAASMQPDPYEVNNTVAQAYSLPVNFQGNNATVATSGSNLHEPNDQDLYKLVLPTGSGYGINARLHDAYNSGNGQSYTVDGMFSYSLDGNNWSGTIDDIMAGSIYAPNGGTVYFHVAPYFQGLIGTYLLQLDITRGTNVGVAEEGPAAGARIYPNPARDHLWLELPAAHDRIDAMEILDAQGRTVARIPAERSMALRQRIELGWLESGAYLLRGSTSNGAWVKRFTIAR